MQEEGACRGEWHAGGREGHPGEGGRGVQRKGRASGGGAATC